MTWNKFESTQENQRDKEKLQSYLDKHGDGETLSWLEIEQGTGIKMTPRGKRLVRWALKSLKRPHQSIRGSGIRLSSPTNILSIISTKGRRVHGAVRSMSRTVNDGMTRHLTDMNEEDKGQILIAVSLVGALENAAKTARRGLAPKVKPLPAPDVNSYTKDES